MKSCELCESPARIFCESDQASLCWTCDFKVHGANFLVARHSRNLLCQACQLPTPWSAAGPQLGSTVSLCTACSTAGALLFEERECRNGDEIDLDIADSESMHMHTNGGDDDDGGGSEDEEEGDNQVVPWSSTPPPPAEVSSSSGEDEFCAVVNDSGGSLDLTYPPKRVRVLSSDLSHQGNGNMSRRPIRRREDSNSALVRSAERRRSVQGRRTGLTIESIERNEG